MSRRTAIDPVLLEVLRNRLEAIADEMELTLLKSAASPIVKEGLDASAALFNVRGETIAQAAAMKKMCRSANHASGAPIASRASTKTCAAKKAYATDHQP